MYVYIHIYIYIYTHISSQPKVVQAILVGVGAAYAPPSLYAIVRFLVSGDMHFNAHLWLAMCAYVGHAVHVHVVGLYHLKYRRHCYACMSRGVASCGHTAGHVCICYTSIDVQREGLVGNWRLPKKYKNEKT